MRPPWEACSCIVMRLLRAMLRVGSSRADAHFNLARLYQRLGEAQQPLINYSDLGIGPDPCGSQAKPLG